MAKIIDTRGLSCPQPVINTKKALEGSKEDALTVIVHNAVSRGIGGNKGAGKEGG